MLTLSPATRIYLAGGATDLRKSFNGLSALAAEQLGQDPLSGHLFLFCNGRRNRLKILYWDGSGLWVCAKRLEKGAFAWPEAPPGGGGRMPLRAEELALLVGGMDLREVKSRKWFYR